MNSFRAFRIDRKDDAIVAGFCELSLDDLSEGEVVIKVSHSTINYKDALAATGAGKILRRYPLVGGIDLAGTVVSSTDARFESGQQVLVNGCGLSETADGGYAEYARVKADAVVRVPEGMTAAQAMQIGTAGYTAALAIHRMEQNDQRPEKGPIVVTGSTGGVGSIAIDMLSARGYEVVALTGKAKQADYLKSIGAHRVLLRDDVDYGKRPMEKAEWGGAIDLCWVRDKIPLTPGIAFFNEVCFCHRPSRTLIVTDLWWNYPSSGDDVTPPVREVPLSSRLWKVGMTDCRAMNT